MAIADPYRSSDDSDEDDEEEEPEDEGGEQVKSEVKAEPGTNKKKPKDANELHIYHEDELTLLKPDQLHADVQLLDGACTAGRYTVS